MKFTMVVVAVGLVSISSVARAEMAGSPLEVVLLRVLHGLHLLLGQLDIHLIAAHAGRGELLFQERVLGWAESVRDRAECRCDGEGMEKRREEDAG